MTVEPRRASDFDYDLPLELIAQEPLPDRAASRLLVVDRAGTGTDERFRSGRPVSGTECPVLIDARFPDLVDLVSPGDLLVLNTTRVRHARFVGMRPSGSPAEVLLVHPAADDSWIAMGKPGSALQPGRPIRLAADVSVETIEVLSDGYRRVRFVGVTAEQAIERFGRLPLPPYIKHDPGPLDEARYQTVYAEREGSIAAPTAGLHFTPALLQALLDKGVHIGRLLLEVGPGTFKPVRDSDISRHPMHPEPYDIPEPLAAVITEVKQRRGSIWAVGTTVVRALESAGQADGTVRGGAGETRLLITPGYRFRVVDRLLTNFHLPRSTLIVLVSAFAGYRTTMQAYRHAIEQRYRFYSYGDAMVVV